jgi:signal transduction histidine kinase
VPAQIVVGEQVAVLDEMDRALLDRSVPPYSGIPEFAVEDPRTVREGELFREFVDTGAVDILALAEEISSPADQGYLGLRTQAADQLRIEANRIVDDAEQQRQKVVLFATAAVLLAVLVTWFASRSITRPLRSLTRQARAMADERLPGAVQQVLDTPLGDDVVMPTLEPIAVRTHDEVADVAKVLNVVQERAVDLAVEQAVLRRNIADSFVNLGRRNQNLVGRQLDFITELERDERDPETLESLFRLDHLATRMRRNAESLLRLAGGEPTAGWDGPVSLLDVVRGALGEIEDYTRVDIRHVDAAALAPGLGGDLSHAVAELLENALTFSPPDQAVEVRGRRTADGYVLAILDNGVGMEVDDLLRANKRLAGEESFTVAPSRYLGHYVAGHLTSRMGVRVQLQPGAAGGTTARIDIPASVLIDDVFATPAAPVSAPIPAPAPVEEREALPRRTAMAAPPPVPVEPAPTADPVEAAQSEPVAEAEPAPNPWSVPWVDDAHDPVEAEPERRTDPAPGFGGLAPVVTAAGDDSTTPSGLLRRVPGAQPPVAPAFANPMSARVESAAAEDTAPSSSPEDVSAFLADFALGVDRGLADAFEHDSGNGNGSGTVTG